MFSYISSEQQTQGPSAARDSGDDR